MSYVTLRGATKSNTNQVDVVSAPAKKFHSQNRTQIKNLVELDSGLDFFSSGKLVFVSIQSEKQFSTALQKISNEIKNHSEKFGIVVLPMKLKLVQRKDRIENLVAQRIIIRNSPVADSKKGAILLNEEFERKVRRQKQLLTPFLHKSNQNLIEKRAPSRTFTLD